MNSGSDVTIQTVVSIKAALTAQIHQPLQKKKVTFLKKRNSFQSSLSQNLAMLLFPFSRLKKIYTFVCVTMCVTGARTVSVQEVLNIFKNMLVLGLVNIVW